ncbi:CD302 antigen [Polypterus senegalus]|uniref:CD302 antigen n=1 Tax=Polypterus senegalus TaxID=55291 RepID=UPI001965369D|nr:CD302 antigen [Polypterus senegalus]
MRAIATASKHFCLLCFGFSCFFLTGFAVTYECPSNGHVWSTYGNSCYYFLFNEDNLSKKYRFESAKDLCQGLGSDLVSINSDEENKFITDYSHRVWKTSVEMWLGLFLNTDTDSLKWFDGNEVLYTNWEHSEYSMEPDNVNTCAVLHTGTGKWGKVTCEETMENGVVCETSLKLVEEKPGSKNKVLFSALVILSVVTILVLSTVVWFLYQKKHNGGTLFTSIEYHPPLAPSYSDETVLVDAEEKEYSA